MRVRAPSRVANASRNAQAGRGRRRRWQPARDALWDFLAPALDDGARVAIVGAGNGDDVPLRRIASRAAAAVLIDIDPRAANGARRRLPRLDRRKVEVIGHDVTQGAADAIVRSALGAGPLPDPNVAPVDPLPGAPYDLIVGDLFYSQLLYPALVDSGLDADRRDTGVGAHGPSLIRSAVDRLHASAPRVVHVHDPIAWWDGHEQPVSLDEILETAANDGPDAALALAGRGDGPRESDPRAALVELGTSPAATALWRWPFSPGVDYLACATLAATGS